jgi:hypothetical protein
MVFFQAYQKVVWCLHWQQQQQTPGFIAGILVFLLEFKLFASFG